MNKSMKLILFVTITLAVSSGFLKMFLPEDSTLSIASLHVFLFNLASGGTLIITHFADKKGPGKYGAVYYIGALLFTFGAFAGIVPLCIVSALFLAAMVEYVRWTNFEWFPFDFFRKVPVSQKFKQAALLCLSCGLIICAATLVNNHYLQLIMFEKLDMHIFFLGFSFPISLSTFSLIFERIENSDNPPGGKIPEFCFWALNLGVIFFFLFILFEIYPGQIVMSFTLFTTIFLTLRMHIKHPPLDQRGIMLISALSFLILGSITGIIYIAILWADPNYTQGYVISIHSAATVFGWNMVWLMLTARKGEFPLNINLKFLIVLHWVFVCLIPFARTTLLAAIPAVVLLVIFLFSFLFSRVLQVKVENA